jgi:hypothetical protein
MLKTLIIVGLLVAATGAAAQIRYYGTLSYYTDRLDKAKEHCKGDTVLWLDTKTGVLTQPGTNGYGTSEQGHYVCQKDVNNQNMMQGQTPPR